MQDAKWTKTRLRPATLLVVISLVAACGGGGSGGASSPTPPPPDPEPTVAELNAASRLAAQATFGLSYAEIDALARQGEGSWLDGQFNRPISRHLPIAIDIVQRREAGEFDQFEDDIEYLILARRLAWWHRTVTASDAVRQRVAFALSEIFVVSDNVDDLVINPAALSDYYDTLLAYAFGNYRELLRSVTLHPTMGIYLSHVNNRRSDPDNNIFPDENYAREVMQLFSIGLFELNIDGSLELDVMAIPFRPTQTSRFASSPRFSPVSRSADQSRFSVTKIHTLSNSCRCLMRSTSRAQKICSMAWLCQLDKRACRISMPRSTISLTTRMSAHLSANSLSSDS